MKKKLILIAAASILLISFPLIYKIFFADPYIAGELIVIPGENDLYLKDYDLTIRGSDRDGVTYFCLPSFCDLDEIIQTPGEDKWCIKEADGEILSKPMPGIVRDVLVVSPEGDEAPWKICFMLSKNVPAVFLDLQGYETSDIDHDLLSPAGIKIISARGQTTYDDQSILIKGRGNGSWTLEKKPYEIRMVDKVSLCGMSPARRWTLLANQDSTGMLNKLAFDMAAKLNMEYAIESNFVDLYSNGVYLGSYLLCKEPHVGKSELEIRDLQALNDMNFDPTAHFEEEDMKGFEYKRQSSNITGGYLFEKNIRSYYGEKSVGFRTTDHYYTMKSPDNASREQLKYLQSFVSGIEDKINSSDPDIFSSVDMYSFARWFLVEEFLFNFDSEYTSRYFYKKADDDRIYAGPLWDLDYAGGEDVYYSNGHFLNWEKSIMDIDAYTAAEDMEGRNPMRWDAKLFEYPEYREYLSGLMDGYEWVFEDAADKMLSEYYQRAGASILMDRAVNGLGGMGNKDLGHYRDYVNNLRYLKFFLKKRHEYLCKLTGSDKTPPDADVSDGTTHTLTFLYPDGNKVEYEIKDGDFVDPEIAPEYDETLYEGWHNEYSGEGIRFARFIPVLEDRTYELEPIEEEEEE